MTKRREIVKMERIRQEFNLTDKLEQVAEFYDYSSRRLRDQAAKGKVLGISYEPSRGIVFYKEGDYQMFGPVPDLPQRFILPRGTVCVACEICSGSVSGLIYQGQFAPKQHQHPEIELMAEPGCSGLIVKLLPFQTKG